MAKAASQSPPAAVRRLGPRLRLLVLDFDGVLTDNTVNVHQDGTESVRCWRGDGLGISALKANGVDVLLLSTETNPVVSTRAAKLQVDCRQGLSDKGSALAEVMRQRGLAPEQVAYLGNDVNDLECLRLVGLPIVVQDAHRAVWKAAKWRTHAMGGRGAVREVCDALIDILKRP